MEKPHRVLLPGLLVATLIAGALRLTSLGTIPVALYCDEAFSGYEAFCLLKTGHDSRGVLLPLFFDILGKGWGEPLYIYLTVPAVALFGLTPLAVRLVAALAGTLAVPITGLLAAALVRGGGNGAQSGNTRLAALSGIAASGLMAISPWPFHLSRVAFQASLLPLALAAGFWLAWSALAPKGDHEPAPARAGTLRLGTAALLLGLSLYTYTIARLVMPLLLAGFVWLHRRALARSSRATAWAALILIGMAAPIAVFSLTARGQQRFSDVAITSRPDLASGGASRVATVAAIAAAAAANYASYYSPGFLLTEGDLNGRHSIRGHGMLHPHDVALLALGAAACLVLRRFFALWWLIVYPIAASLTIDPRHAVRSICGLPGIFVIEGVGAAVILNAAAQAAGARRRIAVALLILFVAVSAVPVFGYFEDYFMAYPIYSGPSWQYGLKEAYAYAESVRSGHDSIYVTRYEDFPQTQLLFYEAFPPREYQQRRLAGTPYMFGESSWTRGPGRLHPIFIWKPAEVPETGVTVQHVIQYPDGRPAFVIAW